ncbi:MAG: periplasmic sensor signal transduction histidine kinase [Rhodocyclaceae bacterium]|nr:periplasmic sensor signal transduction histidine kinase [Rhodocyclaceae bacterium]
MAGGMIPAAASYGLGALAYSALVLQLIHLLWRRRGGGRLGVMLAVAVLSAAWGWLGFAYATRFEPSFLALGILTDILRYGGWYAFLLLLLVHPGERGGGTWSRPPWLLSVATGLGLLLLFALGSVVLGIVSGGYFYHPGLFHMLALAVLALVFLEQLYRNISPDGQWNVKPLCLGLAGVFIFDIYFYSDAVLFNRVDGQAWTVRGAVHGLVVPLLALSVSRGQGWADRIRLSHRAALHTAALSLAGAYLLFIAAVGYYVRYFGGEWGRALQLGLVFAALMVLGLLAASAAMRAKLRVLVRKHFFSYRYDYREEWLRFTRTLSPQDSPREMGQQAIRGLADMLESPAGGLWLKDAGQPFFYLAARWNMAPVAAREEAGSSLCTFLAGSGWVINLEEVRCFQKRYDGLELPAWLLELPNAWLLVPLLAGSELVGFVVLTSPRTPVPVNWEVNDLLKTAGRQAASFIAQMQATEALLEARKFDAFNRMSAFVVHDLKNIVSQLSLMVRNAERHRANPEFQQDMLTTVQDAVDRMRQLMLQLREGSAPAGLSCGVDLARVVGRIQAAKARHGQAIEVEIGEPLVTRGQEERIERVIGHLVQNAIEASDGLGRVWIKLGRQGSQARIEVGDNGRGMSPEFQRERLFKPFQTTKEAGMGIGAYESFLYVNELGGKMLVDSEVNQGTRVAILLPVLEVGGRSGLDRQEAAA